MGEKWAAVILEIIRANGGSDIGIAMVIDLLLPWAIITGILIFVLRAYRAERAASNTAITAISTQIADLVARQDRDMRLTQNFEALARDYKASADTLLQYVRENTQTLSAIAARLKWE